MLYIEYEEDKAKYRETQKLYGEIVTEWEEIFVKTQPKAVQYDRDKVSGGIPPNKFDEYIAEKAKKRIDERLAEVKRLLSDRERLLKQKEMEMRESKDVRDKIYCFRYLDYMRIHRIAKAVNYSEAQIYRILREINENRKHDRK